MAKAKSGAAPSLTDAVLAEVQGQRRGTQPWWMRLPADALQELEAIRVEFVSGRIPSSRWRLAQAISRNLAERGIATASPLVVDRWLAAKP